MVFILGEYLIQTDLPGIHIGTLDFKKMPSSDKNLLTFILEILFHRKPLSIS